MNIELLNKVKEHILKVPEVFDMEFYEAAIGEDDYGDDIFPSTEEEVCNTAHCICGWAAFVDTKKSFYKALKDAGFQKWEESMYGKKLLDLPNTNLFHVNEWPHYLSDRYLESTDNATDAQIAAEAIDSYIATNGWEDEESL